MKIKQQKLESYFKRLKARRALKKLENKSRKIQHQINKK
jgi:hypothetical protein